jgi:hypothetical protein
MLHLTLQGDYQGIFKQFIRLTIHIAKCSMVSKAVGPLCSWFPALLLHPLPPWVVRVYDSLSKVFVIMSILGFDCRGKRWHDIESALSADGWVIDKEPL